MLTLLKASVLFAALTTGTIVTLGIPQTASAETLVTCGPKGAAFIVDIVPAGCRVLKNASPPKQAGNEVKSSALGFYFNASAPRSAQTVTASASPRPARMVR